jgi:alpha-L-arabinofuranosidase
MQVIVSATGAVFGRASEQLLSNNIEAYENTFPAMLSDRLRNAKFAGPENPQTGIAAEWEPVGNSMAGISCRLVPGMYLSGREAQQIQNYTQQGRGGIVQVGVPTDAGEIFEVEIWARAQHRPVTVAVELRLPGQTAPATSRGTMTFDLAHWHRRTCPLSAPGEGEASLFITVPGDSCLVIDQVHLRLAGQTHVNQSLLDAFKQFPCPVLRFPGGCVTGTYHWEHGTGPVYLRPVCDDPVFKYKVHYDFGTDEYLALCAAEGIRPFITLNTTTATPEQAAAWAAYIRNWYSARGLAVPATYFMFGNENFASWELGHMTGEMYVAQLREFVPPVRAAYPEARIMAIGEFDAAGLREEYNNPWRRVVIAQAADLFDILVVTRYSSASDNFCLSECMASVADAVTDKESDLQRQAQTIRDAGLSCTLGIVEWNYWTRASHNDHAGFFEPHDIRHCLYAAGYLNAFCRLAEMLEVANFYSLVNTMGMIHVHGNRVDLSDLVQVFNLYADALPGEVLDLKTTAPALTDNSAMISANCLRTGAATYAFLVNYSASEEIALTLEGVGMPREARGLSATAILRPVTAFRPTITGTTVTMPPMSLVRVTCTR